MRWIKGFVLLTVFVFALFSLDTQIYAEEGGEDTATITFVLSEEPLDGLEATIEAPDPITGPVGEAILHIPTVSSSVYTFLGWYYYDDDDDLIRLEKYDVIEEDLTVYGQWQLTPRVVRYDLDGGINNANNPFIVYANETYTLEDAERVGYAFDGWLLNDDPISQLEAITTSITLTATWTPISVDVTLEFENGDDDEVVPFTYDEAYDLTSFEPTREGFDFDGWLDSEGTPFDVSGTSQLLDDETLTAQWIPRDDTAYTVEIYLQDIVGDEYTLDDTLSLTGTTLESVTFTPDTLTGFVLNEDASTLEGVIQPDGSLVLSVYYDREVYDVTFLDESDDIIEVQSVRYQGDAVAPVYEAPEGFTFLAWDEDFTNVIEALTVQVVIVANTYTLTFEVDGVFYDSLTVTFGEAIGAFPENPEAPQDEVFDSWRDADNNVYTESTVYNVAGDVTVSAVFVAETDVEYTVQYAFEDEAGDFIVDEALTKTFFGTAGETVTASALVDVPDGFVLKGDLPSGTVTTADGGLVLTVEYERILLTVTFEYYEDDTLVTETVDVKYGLTVEAPELDERTGYEFVEWDASLDNITESQTITALYEAVDYDINYDLNDASFDLPATLEDPETSYTIEDEAITLPIPTREHHTFDGWLNTDTSEIITEIPAGSVGDVNVQAQWSAVTYDVTFVIDGDDDVIVTVEFSETLEESDFPEITAPEGEALFYWFYTVNGDNLEFTTSTIVNQDYTLEPLFAPVSTITFDSQEGTEVEPLTDFVGTAIEAPADPTREGYTFDGWFLDAAATDAYTFTTMPAEDLTLYAGWTEDVVALTVTEMWASEPSTDHTVDTPFVITGVVAATTDEGYILQDPETAIMVSVHHSENGFVIGDEVVIEGDFNVSFSIARIINVSEATLLSQGNDVNYSTDAAVAIDWDDFELANYMGELVEIETPWGRLLGTGGTSYLRLAHTPSGLGSQIYDGGYIGLQNGANNPNITGSLSDYFIGGNNDVLYSNLTVYIFFYDSTASYKKAVIIGDEHIVDSEDTFTVDLATDLVDATVSIDPEVGPYDFYDQITITASEIEGYDFVHWFDEDAEEVFSTNRVHTFNVMKSLNLTAVYEEESEVSDSVTVTAFYPSGSGTTNMSGDNNAEAIELDPNLFTVTSIQRNNNPLHIGLNNAGQIRLYGSSDTNGNILEIEIADGYTITDIEFVFGSNVTDALIYTGDTVQFDGTLSSNSTLSYNDLDVSKFSIQNTASSTSQLYILEIIITYTEDSN